MGRKLGRFTVGVYSVGISEVARKAMPTCRACGHQMSLHGRTDDLAPAPLTPVVMAPSGPPPGFYQDPQGSGRQRWWDGQTWTNHFQP